jgi:hypothetical protein
MSEAARKHRKSIFGKSKYTDAKRVQALAQRRTK